jgi:hypothetical protein
LIALIEVIASISNQQAASEPLGKTHWDRGASMRA